MKTYLLLILKQRCKVIFAIFIFLFSSCSKNTSKERIDKDTLKRDSIERSNYGNKKLHNKGKSFFREN